MFRKPSRFPKHILSKNETRFAFKKGLRNMSYNHKKNLPEGAKKMKTDFFAKKHFSF
jgi:hypothetical protein